MNYSVIRKFDISNGPGIRVSLFCSGCEFHCKNCFNSQTWDFNFGKEFTRKETDLILELLDKDYIAGFSMLGGEPLHKNNGPVVFELLSEIYEKFRGTKTIWLWTGYKFEELNSAQKLIVAQCDVVVDGQFIDDLKDYKLKWRGSSNQRVIDVKKTFENNEIVMYNN